MSKTYRVTIPHEYDTREGKRTSFANVGIAFQNKKGISVKFHCNVIVGPRSDIVLFEFDEDENKGSDTPPPDDEIPF